MPVDLNSDRIVSLDVVHRPAPFGKLNPQFPLAAKGIVGPPYLILGAASVLEEIDVANHGRR